MQTTLDDQQLAAARSALTGDNSDPLIDLVFRLNLRQPLDGVPADAFATAGRLGWVDAHSRSLTPIGRLVADPVREYKFWRDRGRRLHGEDEYDLLKPVHYAGKTVLEVGSGFGCNLFSLAPVGGRFLGLEPVALYRQFTAIFAEREHLAPPEVVDGSGESLPFPDGGFDIVLCYSSHQYMDVRVALREMARVLRSGGQLRILGGTLQGWLGKLFRSLASLRLREAKRHALTVANTLWYERTGRRLYVPHSLAPTSAPIYPAPRFMDRWTTEVGLRPRLDLRRRVGTETCFVADRL